MAVFVTIMLMLESINDIDCSQRRVYELVSLRMWEADIIVDDAPHLFKVNITCSTEVSVCCFAQCAIASAALESPSKTTGCQLVSNLSFVFFIAVYSFF